MLPILTTLLLAAPMQASGALGTFQVLDVPTVPSDDVTIDLLLDGRPATLELSRHSLRAADFQLLVQTPSGALVEMPAPAPSTFRGNVLGWSDSTVYASITEKGMQCVVVDWLGEREWSIQPADGMALGTYQIVSTLELPQTGGICGVRDDAVPVQAPPVDTGERGTGLQLCELGIDTDFQLYQDNGQSILGTMNDAEFIVNGSDVIYQRDVDVTFQITALIVRPTSNDPYTATTGGGLLDELRILWETTYQAIRRDTAHLLSGRNPSQGVLGVAYLGGLCSNGFDYGMSHTRWSNFAVGRIGVTAHEIGHNFGADHCGGNDCRIMCAGAGGCTGDLTRFGNASANIINNTAVNQGCLLDLAPPQTVPIFDDFPTVTLNRDLWITPQGVQSTTAALGEPSPSRSLEFDSLNATVENNDRLISNKILLDGLNGQSVSFFSQHRGVPFGGTMVVEYFNTAGNWESLITLFSDGVDQSTFEFNTVDLPNDAYHDDFQIRFTAGVASPTQNWFIDDFAIDGNSCGGVSNYCIASSNSVSLFGAGLSMGGSTSISANDLILIATTCPTASFGIFIYGDTQIQQTLGNGFLCVTGSPLYRLAINQADIFGNNVYAVDQNNLAPGSVINAGETWNFQLWYRDSVGAGFNLTNGLSINFCP